MTNKTGLHTTIATIHKAYQMFLKDQLKQVGLNPGWAPFLLHLATLEGVSQESLAKAVDLDPGTTARALFRLEKEGLVRRKPDTTDRRVLRVSLTRKGREVLPPLQAIEAAWEERLLAAVPQKERATILRSLERVLEIATQDDEPAAQTESKAIPTFPLSPPDEPVEEFPMDDFFN